MIQKSTGIGTAGMTASITKFFSLFGDEKLVNIWEAIKSMPIQDLGMSVIGILLSSFAFYYNENKNENK